MKHVASDVFVDSLPTFNKTNPGITIQFIIAKKTNKTKTIVVMGNLHWLEMMHVASDVFVDSLPTFNKKSWYYNMVHNKKSNETLSE